VAEHLFARYYIRGGKGFRTVTQKYQWPRHLNSSHTVRHLLHVPLSTNAGSNLGSVVAFPRRSASLQPFICSKRLTRSYTLTAAARAAFNVTHTFVRLSSDERGSVVPASRLRVTTSLRNLIRLSKVQTRNCASRVLVRSRLPAGCKSSPSCWCWMRKANP
jgi:hypothetical protein